MLDKLVRKKNILLGKLGYFTTPNFIVVGAQKAGTTGLQTTLNHHTYIRSSKRKEINYFSNDNWYSKSDHDEYHSHFPLSFQIKEGTRLFEATPIYLFHPKVPERLFNYNSKLKLIIVLRDPSLRAFSAWTMYHHHFKTGEFSHLHDPRSFSEAIDQEMQRIEKTSFDDDKIAYVKRGIYHDQIEAFQKFFPKEQICILENKEILALDDTTLTKIQSFLDVPFEKIVSEKKNSSKIDEKEKYKVDLTRLKEFYEPYNEKLYQLIGKAYNW